MAAPGKALESALDELHGIVAAVLTSQLSTAHKEATTGVIEDDKLVKKPVPTATILAAMKFLKDNGIDSPARSVRMTGLEAQLAAIDMDAAAEDRLPN